MIQQTLAIWSLVPLAFLKPAWTSERAQFTYCWSLAWRILNITLHYFASKGPSSPGYGFSSSHVWMWELDCEESWAPKNWCFWTVVLEKTLESPLDFKEIQPVHFKGDQPWDFLEGVMLKLKLQYFGHLMRRVDPLEKDSDAGRDWGQEEKGMTEDEMASPTWWMGVWVNSDGWEWTGKPGVLWFMGWQRVRHDWATELNWRKLLTKTDRIQDFPGGQAAKTPHADLWAEN